MASKQNRILQSLANGKNRPPPSTTEMMWASYELDMLLHWLTRAGEASSELRKWVPVRVISCIEGCIKAGTAALINHGDPYLGNARQMFQQIRIDFEILRALLDDQVSFGEVVAGSVGYHNMAEINSRISALLGFEFFDALRTVEDRVAIELQKKPKKPIIDSLDRVLKDIEETLRLRHILCHEGAAGSVIISEADAERFLKSSIRFTEAASWLISNTLEPNAPLTQTDMNIEAARRADTAQKALDEEIAKLAVKLDKEDQELLRVSQKNWVEYMKAFSTLESNGAKGGTLMGSLYGDASSAMIRLRTIEIQNCLRQDGLEKPPKRKRRVR